MHVVRFENVPDQFEYSKDLSDRSALLMAVGDPRVFDLLFVMPKEVVIVGKDDAPLLDSEGNLVEIGSPNQADFDSRCHVDSTASQAVRDRRINTLIKMEAD